MWRILRPVCSISFQILQWNREYIPYNFPPKKRKMAQLLEGDSGKPVLVVQRACDCENCVTDRKAEDFYKKKFWWQRTRS